MNAPHCYVIRTLLVVLSSHFITSVLYPKQEIIVFSLCFQAILDTEQHSISYTLSRTQAVIVEYMPDEETDMFQVRVVLLHRFCDTVLSL
jgi:pellino protein